MFSGIVYCDMDGVLADFIGSAEEALNGRRFNSVPSQESWSILRNIPNFFMNLAVLPGAKRLWKYIDSHDLSDAQILSAEPNLKNYSTGRKEKILWCKRHLGIPTYKVNIVQREDKKKYATKFGQPNILIDDHDKNIREFNQAGGIGIQCKLGDPLSVLPKLKKYLG